MAIVLDKTSKTPFVHLNAENGKFIFEGVVLPEDTFDFFKPINAYINSYLNDPQEITTVLINLDYFNTSASRMIFNMFKAFHDANRKTKVLIEWYYESDDEDLSEVCDEFMEMLPKLNFIKKPFELENSPNLKDTVKLVQG